MIASMALIFHRSLQQQLRTKWLMREDILLLRISTSVSAAFAATLIAARPKMHGERSGG